MDPMTLRREAPIPDIRDVNDPRGGRDDSRDAGLTLPSLPFTLLASRSVGLAVTLPG